uniref:SPAC17G8.02 protein n=2 Tax=Fopius arisanus TaxID=64838 RepID=A0A0C9PV76_9HYME
MGGSVAGMGNKSPGVEYNFGQDPESNFVTFNSMTFYNKSLLLFPWEACRSTKISREWRTNVLGTVPSTSMSFMNKVEKKILNEKFWTPADVMTAAVMIWPNLSVKTFSTRVTAITDGAARGGLLVDYSEAPEYSNTDIIQELDPQWFKRILLKYLSRN